MTAVHLVKRIVGAGLGMMATVALAAAIWPAVASVVAGLLVIVLCVGGGTVAVLGVRWARTELVWRRRELRRMPPLDAAPYAAPAPGLAQLREPA